MFTCKDFDNHEKVVMVSDKESGLQAFIAIHNTKRGPAAGGCRYKHYDRPYDALVDALRLSRGMTYKNAFAGLPLGGGKAVIMRAPGQDQKKIFNAFARELNKLRGEYNTAIDIGTTLADMKLINKTSDHVFGLNNTVASSTATGGFEAIKGLLKYIDRTTSTVSEPLDLLFHNRTFAIQGLGQTGMALAKQICAAGGKVIVTDIGPEGLGKIYDLRAVYPDSVLSVSTDEILDVEADVFVPCALGGIITKKVAKSIKFKAICGLANNQLKSLSVANILHKRGIHFIPDFVANAGGVIHASSDITNKKLGKERLEKIGNDVFDILRKSTAEDMSPQHYVEQKVQEQLYNGNK